MKNLSLRIIESNIKYFFVLMYLVPYPLNFKLIRSLSITLMKILMKLYIDISLFKYLLIPWST